MAVALTEIERLGQLHASGHLGETEFATAKRQMLEGL